MGPVERASGSGRHKIILLGEHAVVHGHPALGTPLREEIRVEVRRTRAAGIRVKGLDDPGVAQALGRIALGAGLGEGGLAVEVRSVLPAGAGLGGSAALCVAFARAALALAGLGEDPGRVHALAQEGEKVFHGNPSGIDAWLAATDAPAIFRKGAMPERIEVADEIDLAVIVDETRAATSAMVAMVAARVEERPGETTAILDEIGSLVLEGADAVRDGRRADLGRIMARNHALLGALGVSTPALDAICEGAIRAGALGAKLTGAGGGGAVVALCRDAASARRVAAGASPRTALTTVMRRTVP